MVKGRGLYKPVGSPPPREDDLPSSIIHSPAARPIFLTMLREIASWGFGKDGRIHFKFIHGSGGIDFTFANKAPDDAYILERANSAPNQLHVYMCPLAPDDMEFAMAPPYAFYSDTGHRIKTEDPNRSWT